MIYSNLIKLKWFFLIECIPKERKEIQQTFNYIKLDLIRGHLKIFKMIGSDTLIYSQLNIILKEILPHELK